MSLASLRRSKVLRQYREGLEALDAWKKLAASLTDEQLGNLRIVLNHTPSSAGLFSLMATSEELKITKPPKHCKAAAAAGEGRTKPCKGEILRSGFCEAHSAKKR